MLVVGRQMIFTDVEEITKENVVDVINKAFSIHVQNVADERALFDYVSGKQPILEREKEIRSEINERVAVNIAGRIKNFKVGYEYSNPITYVQAAEIKALKEKKDRLDREGLEKDPGIQDDMRISALNEMMREQSKASKDILLADTFKTCGLGYRLILPNEDPDQLSLFRIAILNPMMTFVIHRNDAFREPVLGVSYSIREDGSMKIGAWSRKNYFEVDKPSYSGIPNARMVSVSPWPYGEIPVIEYTNERNILGYSFSCFESVMSILDEINTVNSDRANDISQFVQALLWFHNCQIDSEQKDRLVDGNGLIVTKSNGDGKEPKITYITSSLDQSSVQSYVDYLKQETQEITGVPMFGISTGGSTGTATSMSNGYAEADTRAQTSELEFERSERRAIKMMLAIARHDMDQDDMDVGKLRVSDVGIKFTRNKTYNLTDKVNAWATMLKNGADPLRATEIASFTSDTQQFVMDGLEMMKKIQESYAADDNTAPNASVEPNIVEKPDADKIAQDNSDQKGNSPFANM